MILRRPRRLLRYLKKSYLTKKKNKSKSFFAESVYVFVKKYDIKTSSALFFCNIDQPYFRESLAYNLFSHEPSLYEGKLYRPPACLGKKFDRSESGYWQCRFRYENVGGGAVPGCDWHYSSLERHRWIIFLQKKFGVLIRTSNLQPLKRLLASAGRRQDFFGLLHKGVALNVDRVEIPVSILNGDLSCSDAFFDQFGRIVLVDWDATRIGNVVWDILLDEARMRRSGLSADTSRIGEALAITCAPHGDSVQHRDYFDGMCNNAFRVYRLLYFQDWSLYQILIVVLDALAERAGLAESRGKSANRDMLMTVCRHLV